MSYKQENSGEPGDIGYNGFLVSFFYLARIDIECINDANLTVIFKNLVKKNAVTREKRMLELLVMLQNDSFDFKDEGFIMVWLQLYPHVALDSSKTVRQLAHQIQTTLLDKIGGREFSKYLKTSIPLMLQSLYDDRAISTATHNALLLSFNNDRERVDEKLWVIFHEQIINYCRALIVNESASSITDERYENLDDVLLKYDRAVNGAIQMLLKIITMANKDFFLSDKALEDINAIFSHEDFWDRLLTCAKGSTLNVQLLKSYMQLLKVIFALNEGNVLPVLARIDDVKGLYKLVAKKLLKLKFQPVESSNSSIIYSGLILQFWDTLTCLTSFTNLDSVAKKSLKIKKNFWQLGGSKAYSRLKDFLKLGSCQSSPLYYLIIKSFFVELKCQNIESDDDFTFLNFASSKDAKTIIEKILLLQYGEIRGLNAMAYRKSSVQCICTLVGLFQLKESAISELFNTVFDTLLDGVALPHRKNETQIHEESVRELSTFASTSPYSGEDFIATFVAPLGKTPFVRVSYEFTASVADIFHSFLMLVSFLPDGKKLLEHLLDETLEKIGELYEPQEISQGFAALIAVLEFTPVNDQLSEFASALPSFVSEDFVDLPLRILGVVLEQSTDVDFTDLIGDFFTKLSTEVPSRLNDFLVILNKHGRRASYLSNSEIRDYILSLSTKPNRSESEDRVLFACLDDSEIMSNVFVSCLSDESAKMRLIESISRNEIALDMTPEISSANDSLVATSLKNISSLLCQKFLSSIGDHNHVSKLVHSFIAGRSTEYDFTALSKFLAGHSELFPLDLIAAEIQESLSTIDLSMISLANPLYQNIHLVEFPSPGCCKVNKQVLSIGKFLLDYVSTTNTDIADIFVMLGLCGQYCQDYAFILDVELPKSDIIDLGSRFSAAYANHVATSETIVGILNGSVESVSPIFKILSDAVSGQGPFSPLQFYNARLLVLLFTPFFESLSLSDFDNLEIKYTKLASSPMKLAVLLCSAVKFIGISKKLDRIRNYVFGEILGVRSHQIMESGVTWISLATNFLRVDEEVIAKYEVMPVQKWGMLINHINGWLESDIAFDNEFLPMRCLLSIFLAHLIPIVGSDLPDRAWTLAVDLCVNNLSTAQVESQDFELKYFSMRLFLVLNKFVNEELYDLWKETKNSIIEELVELMINEEIEEQNLRANNQPVILSNDLIERILSRISVPKAFVADKVDKLYKLLSTSKFLNLQRVATSLLQSYILETQQDFVIEYLLRRSNLSDNGDEVDEGIKLPSSLIANIDQNVFKFEESLESKNYSEAVKYLWSWVLIFDHFKDMIYSIKAQYINQIKADRKIESLLDAIFAVADVSDSTFLKKLVITPLEKLSKATLENSLLQDYLIKDGCIGETVDFEMHFLLVHLYYLSFQYLGSFVQQWFNEIRDLQLKKLVESFSTRYVSPILISKMLGEVESQKKKLTEQDENLTIKVNKVINEIKSVYLIDEQTMEMVVKIPETFPLSNVTVEGPVRLGVKENQWKAWLLASQRVISLTNGSIFDCVELFNRNVKLHFSGFEECAICYSILHQDHSLPSKVCPTCLNKFHAACLYKWFKSSGSSTCPLCRCAFNFKVSRT